MIPKRYSVQQLRANLLGLQKQTIREGGGLGRYKVLNRTFTLLGRPADAHQMLITKSDVYQRGYQFDNLALSLGYGLITTEGDIWRRQRKHAQPAFDRDLYQRVMHLTDEIGQDVMAEWTIAGEAGEVVDVYRDLQMLTMRVIGMALFNIDLKTTPHRLVEMVGVTLELAIRRNISPITIPLWLPLPIHRKHRELKAEVDAFINEQIEQRLQNNENPEDILGKLVAAYGDEAQDYREELRDQIVTMFFAGFETTATAISWTCYLLSQNPEAEATLREEVDSVLQGRSPVYSDLDALPYTHNVIQESMRIFSPVYAISRHAEQDDNLSGCPIHKGDNMLLSLHYLHQDPAIWEEPEAFRPERFANLTSEQRRAYMPFGAGKHKCVGMHFSMVEIVVVLALIMQRFRLTLVDGHPVVPKPAVTIYPEHGLLMHVEKRED